MSIKLINNYNLSLSNINFAKKQEKQAPSKSHTDSKSLAVPAYKMVPAMIALAGLTTLNSCDEDIKYIDLRGIKKDCFISLESNEKELSKVDEKQYVLDENTDSVYKESKEYKYNHLKIKSNDHTTVMGNIVRKEDGIEIDFTNVYDEEDKLTSSTIKDPKTKDTFYVTYKDGFITKVTNKKGEQLDSSKYGNYVLILLAGMALYGGVKVISGIFAPRLKEEDIPFFEPQIDKD